MYSLGTPCLAGACPEGKLCTSPDSCTWSLQLSGQCMELTRLRLSSCLLAH